jgi:dynein intermediate chain 2
MLGRYESSYLTSACWSPTRPGVFFTTKMDGTLDIWDIFYKQNEPVFPTKIGESGLTTINVHGKGKLVAVGAVDGSVSLLELSDSLAFPQNGEKATITSIFERESKREKHLDQMRTKRAAGRGAAAAAAATGASSPTAAASSPTASAAASTAAFKSFDLAEVDISSIEAGMCPLFVSVCSHFLGQGSIDCIFE